MWWKKPYRHIVEENGMDKSKAKEPRIDLVKWAACILVF